MPTEIELRVVDNKICIKSDSLPVLVGEQVRFVGITPSRTFIITLHNYEPFFENDPLFPAEVTNGVISPTYTVGALVNPVKYYSVCVKGSEKIIKPPDAPPRIIITPAV